MVDALLSVLKPIDAPGSIPFLLLGLAAGLILTFVWPRNRKLGRAWLLALAGLYLTLSLPIVARLITASLPIVHASEVNALGPLDTVIIFDGDNRRGRVATAHDAFIASAPHEIWVLGLQADWIRDALPAAGVPAELIRTDFDTITTRLQLDWVAARHGRMPNDRMAIIASRLQVPRIAGMAKSLGIDVPIVAAPIDSEPPATGLGLFVPTYLALRVSRDALYEHAAVRYYRSRGWARP